MDKHKLNLLSAGLIALLRNAPAAVQAAKLPNRGTILADDPGRGDLNCYGQPSSRTRFRAGLVPGKRQYWGRS